MENMNLYKINTKNGGINPYTEGCRAEGCIWINTSVQGIYLTEGSLNNNPSFKGPNTG